MRSRAAGARGKIAILPCGAAALLDWNDLHTFLAIQRAGTLAGAAAVLRLNPTTVGRRLAALEDEVGARLFDRTPDGYLLTRAGRDLVPLAERMEAAAFAVEREIAGADQRLAGTVRVSTTEMLGSRFVAPQLPRFRERHPEIVLELSCQARSVSLARRDADVVMRLSRPREDDVVARQVASIRLGLYAAPAYLDARGRPGDRLDGHDVLLFAASPAFASENDWLEARLGAGRAVLRCDSVSAVYAAAVAGTGIALLPCIVADGDAQLERVPSDGQPAPRHIWLGVHRDLQRMPRLVAVLAFLAELVAGDW
jgi:DNA-binding transcriptional LysR family regulator